MKSYEIVYVVWMGAVKHFGQDVALNRPGTLWQVVAIAAHLLLKVSKLTSQLLKRSNFVWSVKN